MTGFIIFVVLMIIFGFGRKAAKRQTDRATPSPTIEKLLERIRAQQTANQHPQAQGQYTQPASGFPAQPGNPVQAGGRAQSSAQLAGMLQALLQTGQQAGHHAGQPGPVVQAGQYAPPGQYQPPQQYAGQPNPWPTPPQVQAPQRIPGHHPTMPAQNSDIEKRVRELMRTGHEVAAIRLLCDEQDLGIIDAQEYARGLITPTAKPGSTTDPDSTHSAPVEEETRYVGSAAFAESPFDLDREENVWASGWVEKPEPEDRTDMDELWQTVRDAGRPKT
ncbi:hypothetical protein [Kribbella catacumbae]|uniref:hypothetical protein n=1 Tax=Kribbella catacumbae TaxID=460086 RepID=UPI0003A433E2|nr:hypothetical protein [Kribbella catacumbae]